MFLTNLSLKRPVLATVTILALIALGLFSYLQLAINDWRGGFPFVAVTIVQQGASPNRWKPMAVKVEEAIGQIAGVKHIYARPAKTLLWYGRSLR